MKHAIILDHSDLLTARRNVSFATDIVNQDINGSTLLDLAFVRYAIGCMSVSGLQKSPQFDQNLVSEWLKAEDRHDLIKLVTELTLRSEPEEPSQKTATYRFCLII